MIPSFFLLFFPTYRNKSGRVISLQAQSYYVPVLPKYSRIIYPQSIGMSEVYKGKIIPPIHGDNDSYAELNLKE